MRIALVLLPALALAACSAQDEAEEPTAAQVAEAPEPGPKDMLDLQATGLTVPAQDGDETMEVPFGSQRAAAEATLAGVLGEATERVENSECGAGPMQLTSYEGMVLHFQDGQFVGYTARAPYVPELSREDMLADPAVQMMDGSTLGEEFTIGSGDALISGLFDGAGAQAGITTMWAGATCIFR